MTDYRLIPCRTHEGPPARIDLNLAPEFRAYMAADDEVLFIVRPSEIADHSRYLRSSGDHVEVGPSYHTIISDPITV